MAGARRACRALPPLAGWLLTMAVVIVGLVFFRAADVPTALALLASMAGLGTMRCTLPRPVSRRIWPRRWRDRGDAGSALIWIVVLGTIALACPNTQELMGRHWFSSDPQPEGEQRWPLWLIWRPNAGLERGRRHPARRRARLDLRPWRLPLLPVLRAGCSGQPFLLRMEHLGMIAVIDLPRQIDPELAADIEKEAAFVSPFLGALRVTGGARRGRARDRRPRARCRGPGQGRALPRRDAQARAPLRAQGLPAPASAATTARSRPGSTRSSCGAAGCSTMAAGTSRCPARCWRWPS